MTKTSHIVKQQFFSVNKDYRKDDVKRVINLAFSTTFGGNSNSTPCKALQHLNLWKRHTMPFGRSANSAILGCYISNILKEMADNGFMGLESLLTTSELVS